MMMNQETKQRMSDGVFKIPMPIRPSAKIRDLENIYKQKQMSVATEKKQHYQNMLQLSAIRHAIAVYHKRLMIEQMRQYKAEVKSKNQSTFLERMRFFSQLPQFQNCLFRIPTDISGWDEQPLSISQIDRFIWENNLIVARKSEEIVVISENSNDYSSTQEDAVSEVHNSSPEN
jgi:hypothetical protein